MGFKKTEAFKNFFKKIKEQEQREFEESELSKAIREVIDFQGGLFAREVLDYYGKSYEKGASGFQLMLTMITHDLVQEYNEFVFYAETNAEYATDFASGKAFIVYQSFKKFKELEHEKGEKNNE